MKKETAGTSTHVRKNHGYYNDIDHILEEISQCDSKFEFRVKHNGAYYACRKIGKFDELCSCLSDRQDDFLWNDRNSILHEAKKYKNMTEFAKFNGSAFAAAHKFAILDDVCSHMEHEKETSCSFSNDIVGHILEVASKCYDFDDFRKNYGEEYVMAIRQNAIEEVARCIPQRNFTLDKKSLFKLAAEFDTFIEFEKEHEKECRAARQSGIIKDLKHFFVDKQRSCSRTKEQVLEIASRCDTYKDFHDNYSLVYAEARRNNWLPDVFNILPKCKHPKYTKQACVRLAKMCRSRRDFATKEPSAYNAVLENGWLECIDAVLPRKVSKPYTEEQIFAIAESCSSYSQFIKEHRYVYVAASRLKILDKVKERFLNVE
ncbi:MAG: hypothetical protein K6E73_10045 [Bacteroidales bacterium]|nr:hypothetical protein [Bacteroidales bacterium]